MKQFLWVALTFFVYRATVWNELFSKYGQEVFDSKDRLVRNLTLKKMLYNRKIVVSVFGENNSKIRRIDRCINDLVQ